MERVRALAPGDAAALYPIFRRVAARAPHARFVPSAGYFTAALGAPPVAGTEVIVAEEGGRVNGMAALLYLPGKPEAKRDSEREARLELTQCFADGEVVEAALVAACVQRAEQVAAQRVRDGAAPIERMHAFPDEHGRGPVRAYNAEWGGLPDGEASLTRVLVRAGFAPVYRELHVTCEGECFPPPLAPEPAGLGEVRVVAGPPRGEQRETSMRAMRGEEELGSCIHATLAHVTDHPDAARWGYIHWLGTQEQARRRGVARYLLTHALHALAAQGCEGCWLTTGAANWEAQPLYLSLGFQIVDTSACFVRPLSPAA